MNSTERLNAQLALEWKIALPLTLKIDYLTSRSQQDYYDHKYRLNPLGKRHYYQNGSAIIGKLRHVLNSRSFYETIFSFKDNDNDSYLYENPYDSRYVHPDSLTAGSYAFYKAGTDSYRSFRSTRSYIGKFDFTSQITPSHQIKTGVELKKDIVDFEYLTLVAATDVNGLEIEPYEPYIEDIYSTNHIKFTRQPDTYAFTSKIKLNTSM
jgi:hypothetical protein